MTANPRLTAPVTALAAIYGGSLYGKSAILNQHWGCIYADCKTFDDYVYIIEGLSPVNGKKVLDCLSVAIEMCEDDLSRIRTIYRHIPRSWKEERQKLLHKAVELASDKDELVATLRDFEIL